MKSFFLSLALCLSLSVLAQDKVGYIYTQEIMEVLPAATTARNSLQSITTQKETVIESMQNELKAKYDKFQAEQETMSQAIMESRVEEIRNLETRMQNFVTTTQQELTQKEQELLSPIVEKIQGASKRVAEREGFTYIMNMDAAQGVYLFASPQSNITSLVKKEMGL